jgi:hypothetical protein
MQLSDLETRLNRSQGQNGGPQERELIAWWRPDGFPALAPQLIGFNEGSTFPSSPLVTLRNFLSVLARNAQLQTTTARP